MKKNSLYSRHFNPTIHHYLNDQNGYFDCDDVIYDGYIDMFYEYYDHSVAEKGWQLNTASKFFNNLELQLTKTKNNGII